MGLNDIEAVVRCWELSGVSTLDAGATPQKLKNVVRKLGRQPPDELMTLYSYCNGGEILEGNIQLYPLDGTELSLLTAADFLRNHQWPIPQELILFAGDGQGGSFGLWLPETHIGRPLVVEVGEIFEGGALAVTGTSLSGFLRGRSAYYALLLDVPEVASTSLGVPKTLTRKPAEELDDDDYEAFMRWANPGLPDFPVSSYEARLTADDVRRLARLSG